MPFQWGVPGRVSHSPAIAMEVPVLGQAEVKPRRGVGLMEYMATSRAGCKGAAALPRCKDGVTKEFSFTELTDSMTLLVFLNRLSSKPS